MALCKSWHALLAAAVACSMPLQLAAAILPNQFDCGRLAGGGISDPAALYGSTVQVNAVAADGGTIYVGGRFSALNGTSVTGFAKITGKGTNTTSAGTLTGVGSNPPEIRAFSTPGASMMIVGSFAAGTPPGGGSPVTMNNVGFYAFNGGTFSAQDSGCNGPVNALAQGSGGPWVIGGSFTSCGSGYGPNIVYLQGSVWRNLADKSSGALNGAGVNGPVTALAVRYNYADSFYYLYVAGPTISLRNAGSGNNSLGLIAWRFQYFGSPSTPEWIGVATADAALRTPLAALMVSTTPFARLFYGGSVGAGTDVSASNRYRLAGSVNLSDSSVSSIGGGFNGASVNRIYEQSAAGNANQEYWFLGNFSGVELGTTPGSDFNPGLNVWRWTAVDASLPSATNVYDCPSTSGGIASAGEAALAIAITNWWSAGTYIIGGNMPSVGGIVVCSPTPTPTPTPSRTASATRTASVSATNSPSASESALPSTSAAMSSSVSPSPTSSASPSESVTFSASEAASQSPSVSASVTATGSATSSASASASVSPSAAASASTSPSNAASSSGSLSPDSADWNAPLEATAGARLRRLQSVGSCGSLPINSGAAYISTPVVTAQLSVAIPAAYLASIGAVTPSAVAAALASLSAAFAANLNSPAQSAAALTATVTTWSSCTGLPPVLGVVASVVQEGSAVVIPPDATSGSVALPVILGLFGGLAVLGLAAAVVIGSNAAEAPELAIPAAGWQSAQASASGRKLGVAGRYNALRIAADGDSEAESAAGDAQPLLRTHTPSGVASHAQVASGRAPAEVLLLSAAQVKACLPE